MEGVPAHFHGPSLSPSLKVFEFLDLEKATRNFSPDSLLERRGPGSGVVFLGWVEKNSLAPSKQGVGIAVAIKKVPRGHAEWIVSYLTTKVDIYSLGVVVLQSISGRGPYENSELEEHGRVHLTEWAMSIQSDGRSVKEIMDPRLKDNYPSQGASECLSLALRCIAMQLKDRPSSEEVLQSLEQIYALYK
ncbi:hypothetical protein SSX86_010182 [Deinandra increscens subsp. villosa]|uniref:Protein kinase domain-containing protein n=1 Tax=Deinandra increscens subsp. villosa TaxID=3103831 RepID=A0AAP0D8I9_9ASTR